MQRSLPPVLLAAMALDLGGAETHVVSLARELRRRGQRVVVASAGGRLVRQLTNLEIPHVKIPMDTRSPAAMLRAYRRLRGVLAEHRIGLVHAHARIPAWIASLAVRGRECGFITTYHGVYNAGFPWRYLTTFGQRTIAVSEDVRRHLVGPLGAPPDQIRVIPNGFDLTQFRSGLDISPLLKEFAVPREGPHLVHASRLDDDLADVALTLLRALPEIDRQVPGVRLWLLGDGNRSAEVRRLTDVTNQQMNRQAAVATGVRTDVPLFLNLADSVAAVARTAVEAMACRRPVIIAGEGGYRGILTPERIDEYARANFTAREGGSTLDVSRLAADTVALLRPGAEGAAERKRLGEAGQKYVTEQLSIEAVTAQILDVYAEVL